MAARLQRTRPRKKGQLGMPPGSKYVGRGSRWGNPARVVYRKDTRGWHVEIDNAGSVGTWPTAAAARPFAVEVYRSHIKAHPELAEAARAELAGRDLACWCAVPEPGETDWCHGAVLLELAARPLDPAAVTDAPGGA
jgi:hypothetical protein